MSSSADVDTDEWGEPIEVVRLTADLLVFSPGLKGWRILMIQRRYEPFRGRWAFPGGHVKPGERFEAAAIREGWEETGLRFDRLRMLGLYDHPERDPRGRYVNVAFYTFSDTMPAPTPGDDAAGASWVPLQQLLDAPESMAFDHHQILTDAVGVTAGFSTKG